MLYAVYYIYITYCMRHVHRVQQYICLRIWLTRTLMHTHVHIYKHAKTLTQSHTRAHTQAYTHTLSHILSVACVCGGVTA